MLSIWWPCINLKPKLGDKSHFSSFIGGRGLNPLWDTYEHSPKRKSQGAKREIDVSESLAEQTITAFLLTQKVSPQLWAEPFHNR